MKYIEILEANQRLAKDFKGDKFPVKVLSNVIINQLKDILEFELRLGGVNANLDFGNYDNILQDSIRIDGETKTVLLFWELSNLIEGLEYKAASMSPVQISDIVEKSKREIGLCLENLREIPLVIFNTFSTLPFNSRLLKENGYDQICNELNDFLHSLDAKNVSLMKTDRIIASIGVDAAIDLRNYYSSKALFKVDFLKSYAGIVKHLIFPKNGKVKKALILDCDNTLWSGILGEDGMEGIKMSATSKKGRAFEAIQHFAKSLSQDGVIVGLCSKNNEDDVNDVLNNHPDQVLKEDFIAVKKVNWVDKASNLRSIAANLNIGLDSMLFVDDSEFEIGLVNEELPEVQTYLVNEKSHLYEKEFIELLNYFYKPLTTKEDLTKVKMYKEQALRSASQDSFKDIQSYLDSLAIEISISKDDINLVPRMAQMTQKTNQFNFTTKRYTESEITEMVNSADFNIYNLFVRDKYGDSGITGLIIIHYQNEVAIFDTFLMSCRVLGRKIENAFLNHVINDGRIDVWHSSFIPTKKNAQVKDFYEQFGFELKQEKEGTKYYVLNGANYIEPKTNHITLVNGK